MSRLVEYRSGALMATGLAALVAGELHAALAARGRAVLAVPGGTTPGPFLRALSAAPLDWGRVTVTLTDDRKVAATSGRSNLRLLHETLLHGPAAVTQVLPLYAEGGDVQELAAAIRAVLPLDCCVLGMGTDGHIASLFPDGDHLEAALDKACDDVVVAIRAPAAPEPRLTLTAPVIGSARNLHLLIAGPDKLATLESAERPGPVADAPVRLVLARDDLTIHYTEGSAT